MIDTTDEEATCDDKLAVALKHGYLASEDLSLHEFNSDDDEEDVVYNRIEGHHVEQGPHTKKGLFAYYEKKFGNLDLEEDQKSELRDIEVHLLALK